MNKRTLSLTLALALPATLALAQRPGGGPPPGGPGGPPPGPPPNQQDGERPPRGNRPPREGDQKRPDQRPLPPLPLEGALDGDHDGIISADEIKGSPEALAKLDKNNDGKLTPNEFLPQRPDGQPPGEGDRPRTKNTTSDRNRPADPFPGQKPPAPKDGDRPKDGPRDGEGKPKLPAPPLIHALDADGDGVISAAEIADAPKSLLTLDKNDDGQLGPRETHAAPPAPRPDGDGPKPPRPPQDPQ